MNWPLISIIITTYNYAHFLRCALDSALSQTYPHIEVLVMDNASSDDTQHIMESYRDDHRIHYFRHHYNIGAPANHNSGLQRAHGHYIVFLSADDMLFPNFLMRSYLYLIEDTDIDIVFSSLYLMNEDGEIQQHILTSGEPIAAYRGKRNDFANLLAFSNYMSFPSLLVAQEFYQRHGGFDERRIAIDFDLVLRWAKAGIRFGYLPEALHAIRIHPRQESSDQHFIRSGRDLEDFIHLIQTYLTPEQEMAIQGYEHNLIRAFHRKIDKAESQGVAIRGSLGLRIAQTQRTIAAIAQRNHQRAFHAHIGVLLFPHESLPIFTKAIQMLLEQSYDHWEAIVLQQPGLSLHPLCQYLAPRGRIRVVELMVPTNLGRAMNQAMILSSSNCFTFMHAGLTIYPRDHLEKIAASFCDPSCSITASDTRFSTIDDRGSMTPLIGAYPRYDDPSLIMAAPIYPLDSIALKRQTIDEYYYFNEQYPIWSDWDMLMRLKSHFNITPIHSSIEQQSQVAAHPFGYLGMIPLNIAQALYHAYPTENPRMLHLRYRYLERLKKFQSFHQLDQVSQEQRRLFFQQANGCSLEEELELAEISADDGRGSMIRSRWQTG